MMSCISFSRQAPCRVDLPQSDDRACAAQVRERGREAVGDSAVPHGHNVQCVLRSGALHHFPKHWWTISEMENLCCTGQGAWRGGPLGKLLCLMGRICNVYAMLAQMRRASPSCRTFPGLTASLCSTGQGALPGGRWELCYASWAQCAMQP